MAKHEEPKVDDVVPGAQKAMDEITEQGFRGTEVDQTPNEHYTLAGVIAGKPTPETDAEQAKKARGDQ
jgi:hypothetical protein